MFSRSFKLAVSSSAVLSRSIRNLPTGIPSFTRCFQSSNGKVDPDSKKESVSEPSTENELPPKEEIVAPVEDAYTVSTKEYEAIELEAKKLHGKLLLKYADAENKRRERNIEIKRRDGLNISTFGSKSFGIFDSLDKCCELADKKAKAPNADEKVKSLAEGLFMTRGIMKNILEKHNISK